MPGRLIRRLKQDFKRRIQRHVDEESLLFFKNSTWLLSANIIRAVVVFARSILIARGLGVELFGVYTIVITFVATVQEFFNLQIGSAVIKYGADYRAENRKDAFNTLLRCSYLVNLAMGGASIGAVALISLVAYEVFLDVPGLAPYILIFAIGGSLKLLEHPCIATLRLFYRFKINALVSTIMALVELGVIALALHYWPGALTVLIVAVTLASIANTLVINVSTHWELRRELAVFSGFNLAAIIGEWKKIWRFVLGTSGSNTLKKIIYKGDVLLLAALAGPVQVSFYAIAKKLASMVKVLTDPLSYTIYPQLALLISAQRFADVKKMIRNVTGLILIPLILVLVAVLIYGEYLIDLAYGAAFIAAAEPLLFTVGAVTAEVLFFWSISLLNSLGLVAIRFKVHAVGAVVGFTLAWMLVPAYGAVGMAVTLLVVNFMVHGSFVYAAGRKMRRTYT